MKAVILAGGLGTRMGSETDHRPKPMLEVGGFPLLFHLMAMCAAQGVNEFVVALGYKAAVIKDYFLHFNAIQHDITVDLASGEVQYHRQPAQGWKVHLIDTGIETMTGGRIRRLAPWLAGESHFLMTYGDGLANIDLAALEGFHKSHGRLATVTAVRMPERFGRLVLDGDQVMAFAEKPERSATWINGGFFILNSRVLDLIEGDGTVWERDPVENLASSGELMAYRHDDFWSGMDTPSDLIYLESLWRDGTAPWAPDNLKKVSA
jgi:glucose-1-phosphate cytidylyltransferase